MNTGERNILDSEAITRQRLTGIARTAVNSRSTILILPLY